LTARRLVELRLQQALRIVAIGVVELPAAAEIDAGRRRLGELFARTRCEKHHCQEHEEPHPAIL
jgi:hypothetical protein